MWLPTSFTYKVVSSLCIGFVDLVRWEGNGPSKDGKSEAVGDICLGPK